MEQKLKREEQKLFRINEGYNFLNLKQTNKKYSISVMLKTSMNLKEKEETIEVSTDLLGYWYKEQDVIDFLKELEEFARKPLVKIKNFNRRNKIASYEMSNIEKSYRDKTIKFSDINISIGELAERKLKDIEIDDFRNKIKEILDLQKKADNKIQELIDKFILLKEKILILEECIGKEKREYYSYGEKKDETIKMLLTSEQYNTKLKEIEKEMRGIAKKLKIEIRDYDFKYISIPKKVSFEKWLDMEENELKENWEQYSDDEQKDFESFEKYAEQMYDEIGGIIETDEE